MSFLIPDGPSLKNFSAFLRIDQSEYRLHIKLPPPARVGGEGSQQEESQPLSSTQASLSQENHEMDQSKLGQLDEGVMAGVEIHCDERLRAILGGWEEVLEARVSQVESVDALLLEVRHFKVHDF